jgi:hypothetical protein
VSNAVNASRNSLVCVGSVFCRLNGYSRACGYQPQQPPLAIIRYVPSLHSVFWLDVAFRVLKRLEDIHITHLIDNDRRVNPRFC